MRQIYDNYGGELALLPGDSNTGKWQKKTFLRMMRRQLGNSSLTLDDIIQIAGENCYRTMNGMFAEAGYNVSLMCVGDHELGGKK